MNFNYNIVVNLILLFSYCLCEVSEGQKEKLLNGFINYYNSLPNQIYTSNEGILENTQQVDDSNYRIVINIKVSDLQNPESTKLLTCTANVLDSDNTLTVLHNRCEEPVLHSLSENSTQEQIPEPRMEVTEPAKRKPVELDNEIQRMNVDITSGEQFIAIPRDQPNAPCAGCATHVNPDAPGVTDLANLGVRQLDLHEPTIKHALESVLDVERQVQVVNGVRYILTLSINFDDCAKNHTENCASSKICRINILVKPWVKLSSGANYRAILSNNCTEDWQFGDTGEVLPELPTGRDIHTDYHGNSSVDHDDNIQAKHNTDLQSQPNKEKTLTEEELKNLQDQIIPNRQSEHTVAYDISTPDTLSVNKEHVFKAESNNYHENNIPATEPEKSEQQSTLIPDKKKAIDELLNFFDFTGYERTSKIREGTPRVKRSYDDDLQVLSLAEDFRDIKQSIESAKFVYEMAQAMVDYLNEMDMEVKNRAVKNVIKAEEEIENFQRFMYIQAQVTTPCDKVECEPKDAVMLICNGVVDSTKQNSPQILNAFCHNDNKASKYRDVVKNIDPDDPVVKSLAEEAVKKIESESNSQYALKINEIVAANTQITSGRLSKLSIITDSLNCNKSLHWALRTNCTVIEQLGSKICEIIIHERHWLKERKIIYSCTERPADMRITKSEALDKNMTVNDPKINEMLQEAIQYLETQSNRNNKQKIVNIKSISTQIIAGFLTKIEFVVGYTNCTDNYAKNQLNECELLRDERLRLCKAQIWDRSWIMDGRQVEVSCDDNVNSHKIDKVLKKRSLDVVKGRPDNLDDKNKNIAFKNLATESLTKFLHSSSIRQHYEVVKVNRATIQDVSGKLTRLDFSISPTDCVILSNGLPSSSKCNVVNPKNISRCHSKILEQVWLEKKQYSVICTIKEKQQNLHLNAVQEQDHTDYKYYQLAEESMKRYLRDTGNLIKHKLVRIEKVTTQMVSGLLTTIDFVISPNNASDTIRCNAIIFEKHRLGTKNTNVTCHIKENNMNDLMEENLDNQYMQIAVESLQEYIKANPDSNLIRVTFVDKVIPLAGGITKIQYLASRAEDDDGDTLCYAEFSEEGHSKSYIAVKCNLIGRVLKKTEISADDQNYLQYVQLADESLQKYIHTTNNSQSYSIISLESAVVTWDDGVKTSINFTISQVDVDDNDIQGKQCRSEILEQPWLQKKHIDISCNVEKQLYRTKRQVLDSTSQETLRLQPNKSNHSHLIRYKRVTGRLTEQDPSNPKYKSLAEESLRKYLQDTGSTQKLQLVEVENVRTQVVAGTLTFIDFVVSTSTDQNPIKCHSEIWERTWLNKKDIKVSCQITNQRQKRQIPGGKFNQDPNNPKYRSLAEESLRKYLQDTGNTQNLQLVEVENVSTQVVAGTLTFIEFVASTSTDQNPIKCHSEIWERTWLNKKDIKVSCQISNQRQKRQIPGGKFNQDPNDPKYRSLAEESLRKYLQDTGSTQKLQLVEVENVSTQVVAGTRTFIDFVATTSTDQNPIKCHSEIWEQAWLEKKEIDVSCQITNQRQKRHIPGGKFNQDPNNPKYRSLAEESLRKYLQDTGNTQNLQLVEVENVSTQVVAGTLTYIEFVASTSTDQNPIKCHSEIWERTWLNKKDIKVSCQITNQRQKRQIPGGKFNQDPNDPKYRSLAEESLRKYLQDTGSTQKLQLVEVENVRTQVVAGTLTFIDFVASTSTDQNPIKCHSEIWERTWLNKKDIKVSCQITNQRQKRQIPGGKFNQDPNNPKYRSLAEESLRKYLQDTGNTQNLQLVEVENVSTQVVAGTLTFIEFVASTSTDQNPIKCHSEIWERTWLNKKDIKVSCQITNQRQKRQIPGGKFNQDPNDPKYRSLAEESLRKYLQDTGSTQKLQLVEVENVSTQVVAGTRTFIDFVATTSTDQNPIKCHSEIWERTWLNKKDIKVSCQITNQRQKRQIPGGKFNQDPNDPKYRSLAEESLRKYLQDTGSTQKLQLVEVENVSTQVVAGTRTFIDFVATTSTDQNPIKCHSEIWEQAWLEKKEIDVSCQITNQRQKRHIPGGKFNQDPNNPKYRSLAEESLRKYLQDTGNTQNLQLVEVENVSTQVVAGTLTYIEFVASTSTDQNPIKCHSEIWERTWLNKKDIKVSCQITNQRQKRQIPGGKFNQDPNDPKYRSLAEESLRKYLQDTGSTQKLQLVEVENVSTQVVAGTRTFIDFVATTSTDQNPIKCHSEIWERTWLNKKDIKVSCQITNQRQKRQIPGGKFNQDPNDPKYRSLAEESLRKYLQDTGSTQKLQLVEVENVSTQVVAGTRTFIDFVATTSTDQNPIKCHSEIWEQAWLEKKEIDVSCQITNQRQKRHIPGGKFNQDPNNPKYRSLAEESLRKYLQDTGNTQNLQLVEVENVSTQVVAGTLTYIEFVASTSTDQNPIKCHSEIWERTWLNKKDIKVSCQITNQRQKRQIPGGKFNQDPNDPKYRSLAEESLRKYLQDTGSTQKLQLVEVENVSTQVVAGTRTFIDFVATTSTDQNPIKCHSEIWEQAWLEKKEIDVSCQITNQRQKRHIPGGKFNQDPNNPKYRSLAEESLRKYLQDTGNTQNLQLVEVENVSTQVVAGTLTYIEFVASTSTDQNPIKCHSEIWERTWLNKKDIKVSCQITNQRQKRQIPGGKFNQDPNDPKYRSLAEESLRKYLQDTGSTQKLQLVEVENVRTQVVAETLTFIDFVASTSTDQNPIKCHSEIWERTWLNKKDIKVSCQITNQRQKRQIPGGKFNQDPNNPKYRSLAEESLRKYLQDTGNTQNLQLVEVENVSTQVVAGTLTFIEFVASTSTDQNPIKCHSEIWERTWLNKKDIKVSCQITNQRQKRQIPGGKFNQDSNDPKYRSLAEESLRKYLQDTGSTQKLQLVEVENVSTQVVAGTRTFIDFVATTSTDQNPIKCHSEIWEQAWLEKKEIDVSCQITNQRQKRHIPGGKFNQDPNNPKYRSLAEESLRKYLQDTGSTQKLQLVEVENVGTQIVAGTRTFIDFVATTSTDQNPIKCHSEIWEQAWLNKKDINVTCKTNNLSLKKKRDVQENIKPIQLRGHVQKDQDSDKQEYRLLAEESLRKFERKSNLHHKVIEVKHVLKQVVSGFKYKITFYAAPTKCPFNVSKVQALGCKAIDDIILNCYTEIWDRPWLKQKKIEVQCNGPEDGDFDAPILSKESPIFYQKKYDEKHKLLAEEATEKYLTITKKNYVHKVTDIHSISENTTDGIITKLEFSISPTNCLRNDTRGSLDTCEIKNPLIVFHCYAKIWDRPYLNTEREIKVTCKKLRKLKKHSKRDIGIRNVRQIDEDEEIDEDTTYYYADRAVQHVNDGSQSNNLHKLITIHAVQSSVQMNTLMVRLYIEIAETFCLRENRDIKISDCEEMDGLNHRLCLARLWPSPDDELIVRHVSVVCDDDPDFAYVTGLNIAELLKLAIQDLERSPDNNHKLVHQGEPQIIPSLDSRLPVKLQFIIATTNCSKDVNLDDNPFQCFIQDTIASKSCSAFIWLSAETRTVRYVNANCRKIRGRRSLNSANVTTDNLEIRKLVMASLQKLEMSSLHRYKQRVLQINSHSTKLTSGKVTTIDFDVGYTSCLKYEWVENITSCDFIEHLPRRRCVAQIWERLWIDNGKNIDVNCVDDETPLENHIEFESAEMANQLANEALKHIEAKYPHPKKQKIVRIFSLEKQVVAGIHYRMKVEVGMTDCYALSEETNCKFVTDYALNKFCQVNVWVRTWTDHPPNYRVTCDFQEGASHELYHQVQAEHLFLNFLTTYSPNYVNDYSQMKKRFQIFKKNIKKIHEFNVYEKGTARYGVTRFTDLTYEEFSSRYMGLNTDLRNENQVPMKKADIPDIKTPHSFDWREHDAVTEVKDQGSCGSCWAFSVTGNIEGQWKMQSGKLVSLSEQELVDCDKLDDGCNGGLPDNAYRAIEQLGGLELEADYPYEAEDDKCLFNKTLAKVQISGAVNITSNETGMAQWLVHNGPISIGINANAMQFYMGGISHPWKMLCNPTNLDHGVLIVGYGVKDYPLFHKTLPYWIVKNSWGKSWGEQGYYRVYRGDGTCGVNQMASSAVI